MKVRHLFESLRKNIYNPIKQFGVLYGLKIISYKMSNLLQMRIHRYGYLGNKNIKTAIKVLKSRKWSRLPYPSPLSAIFTKQFLEFQSGNYGLCVSNGTEAIKVALKAAGLKYGDEIIISSLTFHSTANAALELGIIPVFVDIDRTTLCIDTEKISKLINKKTKAILTVHLGSVISDLDELVMLCDKYNLKFIEDCAHSHGGMWKNKGVGSYGDFGCFSFQMSKLMSSGEGGFIMMKNQSDYEKCLSIINVGKSDKPFSTIGLNSRLTEIQSALLIDALKGYKSIIDKIHNNIIYFTNEISKIKGIEVLKPHPSQTKQTGYVYGFRLTPSILDYRNRKDLVEDLNARGFNCFENLYPPVYLTHGFGWKESFLNLSYRDTKCVNAEYSYKYDVIWINHNFFKLNRSSIKHGVALIKDAVIKYPKQFNV
tara:strand:+ start:86 stop:1366 length:1281 start_codon:yes stop_codon:yes gene_type:complete